ncbi:MAG: phasin family protein [Pseudomonadota bacterium]
MSKRKKRAETPSPDTARRIWLAGIGAYGRAFSEAQESLARMTGETTKVFDDLVEKGEEIEKAVEEKGREVAARVAPGGVSLEDRIQKMRTKLGRKDDPFTLAASRSKKAAPAPSRAQTFDSDGDLAFKLHAIDAKLDRLIGLFEVIAEGLTAPLDESRAPAKKRGVRKTATTKKTSTKTTRAKAAKKKTAKKTTKKTAAKRRKPTSSA